MLDSLTFRVGTARNLEEIRGIGPISYRVKSDGQALAYCYLGSLRLVQWPDGMLIKGSLPKYYKGNNVSRLGRSEIQNALEGIQETLKTDLSKAEVLTLEYGECLPLVHPVGGYLGLMGELSRHKRDSYNGGRETIIYRTECRSYELYDKGLEARKKREPLPLALQGQNILRLELRIKKRVQRELDRKVFVSDLSDESFHRSMIQLWLNTYRAIRKERTVRFEEIETMTPRGLLVQLAAMQVAELGLDQILAVLDYERGKMEKKTLQRMKAMIRELSQSKALTDTAPLIEELDRKVEMAATYYR